MRDHSEPTENQLKILAAIFILTDERNGISPTLVEISRRLNMKARTGCQTGVEALIKKGCAERVPRCPRTLRATEKGLAYLQPPEA